jgi:hypothetical protein
MEEQIKTNHPHLYGFIEIACVIVGVTLLLIAMI